MEFNRFKDGVPYMSGPGLRDRLPGVNDVSDLSRAPKAVLMDIVARLQLKVVAMKAGTPDHQTLGGPTSPVRHKPVMFTSTKVPRFAGVTSWEQYQQIRCYCAVKWVGGRHSCSAVIISPGRRCAKRGHSGAGGAMCNANWTRRGTE